MNKEITMIFTNWKKVILIFFKENTETISSGGE
jgi:hypothetical protein